eukprot:g46096.t1
MSARKQGRRDAMLEAALPHVVKVVSVGKSAWKTWVQESDQGNKGHRLESFYKYDRWANTSCRSEQLTVEEQDFKWCFSLTLRQAIFPAILGADREKVPNMKDLRRSKKLRPVYSALLAFLQQFTTEKLLDVPYAFTVAHTLESIQELLTRPVTQYKHHLRKGGGLVRVDEGPATKEENDEDLEKALIANSGLSREVSGTRCEVMLRLWPPCTYDMRGKKIDWTKFRACDNPLCSYMLPPTCTLCPICQVRQLATPDEAELRVPKDAVPKDAFYLREEREEYVPDEEWDPDALDAVPPPKWVQEEAGVPRAAERCMYMHLCALDKVKKSYFEIEWPRFLAPPGAIFGVKLHPDTVLVEVEEIRGNHNVSPTLRMGPDTHASVNGKIKQVLQEHWNWHAGCELEDFHQHDRHGQAAGKVPRARNLRKWMASRPSPALTPRLNPTKNFSSLKERTLAGFFSPCQVPTDVDAEVNAYVEQAPALLSHDQANVMCPQNVLHHPRERLQRVLYTPSSKHSSSSCSIAKNMLNAVITITFFTPSEQNLLNGLLEVVTGKEEDDVEGVVNQSLDKEVPAAARGVREDDSGVVALVGYDDEQDEGREGGGRRPQTPVDAHSPRFSLGRRVGQPEGKRDARGVPVEWTGAAVEESNIVEGKRSRMKTKASNFSSERT